MQPPFSMAYFFELIGIRFVMFLLAALPLSAVFSFTRWASGLVFLFMRKRRRVALENVERAYGDTLSKEEKESIARGAFENASLALVELFVVERIKKEARERFTLIGNEHLEKVFAEGRGAILVIAHLGSWEFLSFLPFLTGQKWSVIVKDIKNPGINKIIDRLRREMTVSPLSKTASIKPVFKELRSNHGVAILIDQWSGPDGMWVDFFGSPTSTTSVPARLAEKTGAALVPAYCLRTGDGRYEIHIEPPVPFSSGKKDWEAATTADLNKMLEELIRRNPKQWLWGHRRWKPRPKILRASET